MLPVFWSVIGSVKRLFALVGVSRTPKVDDFVKAVFTTGRRQTETLYYAKVCQVQTGDKSGPSTIPVGTLDSMQLSDDGTTLTYSATSDAKRLIVMLAIAGQQSYT
nr:hypothetical protein BaRGS_029181 [Batillaria attramentaria]